MTSTLGRWPVVVVVLLGSASVATVARAQKTHSPVDDRPSHPGAAEEWSAWREAQMTGHMGRGAVEWMESHSDVSLDEMTGSKADRDGRHATPYRGC